MDLNINDVLKMNTKLLNHLEGHIKEGSFDYLDIKQSEELKKKIKELKQIIKKSKK